MYHHVVDVSPATSVLTVWLLQYDSLTMNDRRSPTSNRLLQSVLSYCILHMYICYLYHTIRLRPTTTRALGAGGSTVPNLCTYKLHVVATI